MIVKKIISRSALFLALLGFTFLSFAPLYALASASSVNVWWPTNGSHIMQGVQPFKAMIQGLDVSQR